MTERIETRSAAEVLAAVAGAVAAGTTLEVVSGASKRGLGRPVTADAVLDTAALNDIVLYEPDELVLTVQPGAGMAELEALLANEGQAFAFEPPDFGPLLGRPAGEGSIGGIVSTGLSGPRRIKAGAARDHVLGVHAVSGRGEAFKSGGRVVKNVTGYDLSKGLTGAYGTLAVFTELSLKVLPAAATEATLLLAGLDAGRAVAAMSAALGAPVDVSGAAHLPAALAKTLGLPGAATLIRLDGIAPSVHDRFDRLTANLRAFGHAEKLDAEPSTALWRGIRDVVPFVGSDAAVWRVSVAPSAGPAITAAADALGAASFLDWGGGLVWVAVPEAAAPDLGATVLRAAVATAGGGHATLVRASADARLRIPVFEPQPPALAALAARLKAQFDPLGILNPGRLVPAHPAPEA
ncbi:glycolate oxidase subunit GlcE [Methylobrevis albus]|uniref:Glycolate oxidase subunit GlcE n=1 Tax=Methylobrevis albus TaxID=2793297 RepID=A0A931I2R1_9HYPH|nr:glycolate oxidase subunit GlcE [Methylobrevis albus]MBH0238218.1 glycolate oxidase subunit GlcE [Methylobrevis albus]